MAKLHRRAADVRPMKESSSERALAVVGAGSEAATALDEWEAEGGTSADAGWTAEDDAPQRTPLERLLLERLGVALVGEWSNLPARLQRTVYERAVRVSSPSRRPTVRRQMARFLHEHKTRARRASPEAALADGGQGTASERV